MGGGWSAKFEYLYYDLGDTRSATVFYNYPGNRSSLTASTDDSGHIVRIGVNYKVTARRRSSQNTDRIQSRRSVRRRHSAERRMWRIFGWAPR